MQAKQFSNTSAFVPPHYTTEDINLIEKQTKQQSECQMWRTVRKGRITASIAHDVITKMHSFEQGRTDDDSKLVELVTVGSSANPNLPAFKYGRENEPRAADQYLSTQRAHHTNLKVESSGLFVDGIHSFLCASPDRLISCDCCGEGLLEVKCPITIAGQDPKLVPLSFLSDFHGERNLRIGHKYYTQMQMQMALSKRKWCDFFVYSTAGHYLQRVKFDAIFWQTIEASLINCYYTEAILSKPPQRQARRQPCIRPITLFLREAEG